MTVLCVAPLFGSYPMSVLFRYCFIGSYRKENFGAVNIELTPDEMQEIDEALSHMELMNMGRG